MARTKASVGAKVSSGKSSKARCSATPSSTPSTSSGSSERSAKSSSGGNPVCPRETPKWQKPITTFFIGNNERKEENNIKDDSNQTTSKSKPRRPVIESDSENEEDVPKNRELDESIVLEPLSGENSHKIDEYLNKNEAKGKGKGKKTKGKENVDQTNLDNGRKSSLKRTLDDEEMEKENTNKKVKADC